MALDRCLSARKYLLGTSIYSTNDKVTLRNYGVWSLCSVGSISAIQYAIHQATCHWCLALQTVIAHLLNQSRSQRQARKLYPQKKAFIFVSRKSITTYARPGPALFQGPFSISKSKFSASSIAATRGSPAPFQSLQSHQLI